MKCYNVLECTYCMVRNDVKQVNLSMSEEKFSKLENAWKKSDSDKSIPGWIMDSILMQLEKEDFLQTYAPFLSKKIVDGNSVVLRDDKLGRLVEVTYRKGKLWCDIDEDDCCPHVHFALCLPELAKLKSND